MPSILLSPRTIALIVLAIVVTAALLVAVPGLGGPVIHYPPFCPPNC